MACVCNQVTQGIYPTLMSIFHRAASSFIDHRQRTMQEVHLQF